MFTYSHHDAFARAGDPELESLKLAELPESHYPDQVQRVADRCAPSSMGAERFESTVEFLNNSYKIGIDKIDCRMLGLMMSGLAEALRFRNEIHMEPCRGENAAVHTCQTVVYAHEQFRRAIHPNTGKSMLHPDSQDDEVIQLRTDLARAICIHDMGEMVGEISSLSESLNPGYKVNKDAIEKRVFEISITLAYRALETGDDDAFDRELGELKLAFLKGPEELEKALETVSLPSLSADFERRKAQWLDLFYAIEGHKENPTDYERFLAHANKVIEHTQGTRHMLRMGTKGAEDVRIPVHSPLSKGTTEARFPIRAEDQESQQALSSLAMSLAESRRVSSIRGLPRVSLAI